MAGGPHHRPEHRQYHTRGTTAQPAIAQTDGVYVVKGDYVYWRCQGPCVVHGHDVRSVRGGSCFLISEERVLQ